MVDEGVPAEAHVALVSAPALYGIEVATMLADVALAGDVNWELSHSGEPPPDHFIDVDADGDPEAIEVPIAYTDDDASGAYSSGDTQLGAACVDGVPIGALWLVAPGDITEVLYLESVGVSLGWVLVPLGEGSEGIVSADDALHSTAGTSCTLD
jgi:hypothetical protein